MASIGPLQELNSASRTAALKALEPFVENSPWVAEIVVDQRPFASAQEVAQSLVDTILASGFGRRVALFRAHPELAGREAVEGRMTEASTSEQGRLRLTALAADEAARLTQLNAAYMARFGHPFILALHRIPDLKTVFDVFEHRLAASPLEEHVNTLAEIASVIGARVAHAFGSPSGEEVRDRPIAAMVHESTGRTNSEVTDG